MTGEKRRLKIIAELLSAAAVVASLVFVAIEVRETARQTELNTEALRVTAYQNLIGQIAQFNVARLDPELAEVYGKMQGPTAQFDALSPVEQMQAEGMLFLLLRHADMAYYQYELGLLPDARLESALMLFLAGDIGPCIAPSGRATKAISCPASRPTLTPASPVNEALKGVA